MTTSASEQMLYGLTLLTAAIEREQPLLRSLLDRATSDDTIAGLVAAGAALAEVAAIRAGITPNQVIAQLALTTAQET